MVTVEEAARRLSIGRTMAYQLVADRLLESVTIGRARRVPVAALAEYVEGLRKEQQGHQSAA
jgi:excisionase family DNA binding protein